MALTINKLQVRESKYDSLNMIDRNHWSRNANIKPEVFGPAERVLFSSITNSGLDFGSDNVLEQMFGLGKTRMIDDLTWSWKMKVHGNRPMTILKNLTTGNTPGRGNQNIRILADIGAGSVGDQWSSGSTDKSQVATIVGKVQQGTGYVYTLKTYTKDENHFINPKYLEPGSKWNRLYSIRGEAAESGGGLEKSTNIEFKNQLVKLRKQFYVTDYGDQARVVDIAYQDNEGNVRRSWFDAQQVEFHQAMNREMAMYAMYSQLGRPLIDPDSGYSIVNGSGLQEQISFGGNVEHYTTLSAELIEAFFERITFSRISPKNRGEVIGFSGEAGMKAFAKAIDKWVGERAIIRNSNDFVTKDPTGVSAHSLTAGYQFTRYNLPNGGTFKLIHNPLYDDKSIHRDLDERGIPLESSRITILDVTQGNGISTSDNVFLVRKNGVQATTIVQGRVGPGNKKITNASHSGDYYRVDISDSIGIQVTDPTSAGELIKTYA